MASPSLRKEALMQEHRQAIAAPVGDYFSRGLGHMSVTDKRTQLPGYPEFQKELEMHLAFKVLILMLIVSFVTVAVHYFRVVTREVGGQHSTFHELGNGPVLILCVSGLIGIVLMFMNYGDSSAVYYAMHAPLVLIVGLTFLWAWQTRAAEGDRFIWSQITGSRGSIIWGVVMSLVLVYATMKYLKGRMRLDGLHMFSGGSVGIVGAAVVLAVVCSRIFELFILTLRHNGITEDSGQFAGFYLLGVGALMFGVVVATRLLDFALIAVSGHWQTAFAPPAGLGAGIATSQTFRALRFAIYSVVGLTAALSWRREKLIITRDPVSGEYLEKEWQRTAMALVAVPLIAMVVEFGKELAGWNLGLYKVIKGALASLVILVVTTGVVPWTNTTVAVAGTLVAIGALEFVMSYGKRSVALISLVLGALFSVLRVAHRQWISGDGGDKESHTVKWWALVVPAIVGLEAFVNRHRCNPFTPKDVIVTIQVFTRMLAAYTIANEFLPDLAKDLIPGNEPASMAIDTFMLMGLLMTVGGGMGAVVACDGKLEKMNDSGVASSLSLWVLGAAAAVGFIQIRQSPDVSAYFGELQGAALKQYQWMYHDALK